MERKHLLRYCFTYFNKHIQNVQNPGINILNAVDYFRSIGTKTFATILQIRSKDLDSYVNLNHSLQVDVMTIICSTALFTLPHLHKVDG